MPTASPEVRKPWHTKKVWVRLSGDRAPIRFNEPSGTWAFFGWTRVDGMDMAAERFLRSRGYVEHRFMWYRPAYTHLIKDWNADKKETSALWYLVDEWDHSFDLRPWSDVLKSERERFVNVIFEQGTVLKARECAAKALTEYAVLARKLK